MTANSLSRHIENPVTGDRISFIQSPMMGEGDMLIFRCRLAPHAKGSPAHVHEAVYETFLVEHGEMTFTLGAKADRTLTAGEGIDLPPGTVHGFRNRAASEAWFVSTANPGIELEAFLRALYDLAARGQTDGDGNPKDLRDLALILSNVDLTADGLPRAVQKAAIAVLAWFARLKASRRSLVPSAAW
ncbi:MAG: cupin domain-containing protein [Novosphingobium sp.]|uniref:cupin domain-containing protein n=1 Tax=Novosphingobium sp. TaxID=1874826 RepID=UPI0030170417